MTITIRRIVIERLGPASLAAVALALLPATARARDPDAPGELVAEALFLGDPLPPGGRDVNLSVTATRAPADPRTGAAPVAVAPRAQVAIGLSERIGFTADVGLSGGSAVDAPSASLKLLLVPPAPARTGIAASLDVFGSTRAFGESEAGLGAGLIRSLGPVALRASASLASAVGAWTPHLHAGASAAAALGARWRALVEVVSDVGAGAAALSAGPTVKLALDDRTSLMAGALFPVTPGAGAPTFALQLGRSL